MLPFARTAFEIYWGEDQDISQDSVLAEVCKRVGVDAQAFFAGIGQQAIKDQLKANTDEVMKRGGFGSPTIFLDQTDMYFGNDRLPLLREALARKKKSRLMPRAVVCRELGPPERLRLESFASRSLAAGEVRVAIRAAGLNFPDVLMVAGEYQLKPELPFTPGMEAAGDVVDVGSDVSGVAAGDKVIVKMRHGAFTEEAVVTPAQLAPLPTTFDYAEGATFLAAHGTAYHALVDRGQLKAGETLLVHGAGGGVGLAAVEIGKLLGATVIAAASSEEKLAVAQARGADHLVLTTREPFRDAVKRITDGRGVDVVFDPVGGEVFENSVRCIAWGARLLVIGFTGGIGACAHQSDPDQGRERARRARRRGGAQGSGIGRSTHGRAVGVGGAGQGAAERLASPAAGGCGASDAAPDRAQGDRPRGAGDGVSVAVIVDASERRSNPDFLLCALWIASLRSQ